MQAGKEEGAGGEEEKEEGGDGGRKRGREKGADMRLCAGRSGGTLKDLTFLVPFPFNEEEVVDE